MLIDEIDKFSSEELRAYFKALDKTIILSVSDISGNIISVNQNFEKAFGYKLQEVVNKNYNILNSGTHDNLFFKSMWEQILNKKNWIGEVCNKNSFNEFLWFKTTIIPIINSDNIIEKFITIRENITELKETQLENWRHIQFQSSINKSTNNLVLRTDLNGNINYINTSFEEKTNYELHDLESVYQLFNQQEISAKTKELNLKFNCDIPTGLEVFFYKTKNGIKNETEWQLVKKNKQVLNIKFCISYIYDQDQIPIGYIFVGIDITEQKEIENTLLRAKEEVESALKVKNNFLGRLSHEIKTPLNGIIGMTELLSQTDVSNEQKDYLDLIQQSSNRLLSMINKVLEYNSLENKIIEVNERNFTVSSELLKVENVYSKQCDNKKLTFKIINKLTLDNFKGEVLRIFQIVNYLLENAIKFTSHGQISLTVFQNEESSLVFEIRDTGEGIIEAEKRDIFKPYVFEQETNQDSFNGLGLSLAISSKIAEGIKGKIYYKTSVGHGSLFSLAVPVKSIDHFQLKQENSIFNVENSSNLKVLIVEDDLINQRLFKKMLNKLNIFPEIVSNGLEAIEIQALKKFEIIFMDVNMPVMDGLEATKRIRENQVLYGAPFIIAVTANSITGDEQICLKVGMDDYIAKPIKREVLHQLMKRFLSKDEKIIEILNEDSTVNNQVSNRLYFDKIAKNFAGDEEILLEFLNKFIKSIPSRLLDLENAILANDFKLIKLEAYNLQGVFGTLYQDEIQSELVLFEKYGNEQKIRNIFPMYLDLKKQVSNLISEITKHYFKEDL